LSKEKCLALGTGQLHSFFVGHLGSGIIPPRITGNAVKGSLSDISRDGSELLSAMYDPERKTCDVWSQPLAGGLPRLIVQNACLPKWSADGSKAQEQHRQEEFHLIPFTPAVPRGNGSISTSLRGDSSKKRNLPATHQALGRTTPTTSQSQSR
jgi:hypothetical protein